MRTEDILHLALFLLTLLLYAPSALAQPYDDSPPSAFEYGYRGLVVGGVAGLGAGYLAVRGGGVSGDDWKDLVFGAGVGALTCAGAGVVLGLSDPSDGARYAHFVLRDSAYGVTFGALAGAAAGGLVALRSDDPEHMLLGASIGSLIGLGVGVTVGAIAGSAEGERMRRRRARGSDSPTVQVTVGLLPGRRGRIAGAGPWLRGTF